MIVKVNFFVLLGAYLIGLSLVWNDYKGIVGVTVVFAIIFFVSLLFGDESDKKRK